MTEHYAPPPPDAPPLDDYGPPPVEDAPGPGGAARRSMATVLAEMAREHYRLVPADDGQTYAVAREGTSVVMPLSGPGGLEEALSALYWERTGSVPSGGAISDAVRALRGALGGAPRETVALRCASTTEDGRTVLYVDTGEGERYARLTGGAWQIVNRSPVLFRRVPGVTSPVPPPVEHPDGTMAGLAALRTMLNVGDDVWSLLVVWCVAAWLPEISHPILAITGPQGAAKTTALRMLTGLVDPTTTQTMSQPDKHDDWRASITASWVICLDNVSRLPTWLQDALCKTVTGDAHLVRELYTTATPTVFRARRVLGFTSIDPGRIAGDVADRMMPVSIDPIPEDRRRSEADLWDAYAAVLPYAVHDLLTLAAQTLDKLPAVTLDRMPRLADFARLCAAFDAVTGEDTLPTYLDLVREAAQDATDSDPFATALVDYLDTHGTYHGTVTDLGRVICPDPTPRGWPTTPMAVSGRLTRADGPLDRQGYSVERLKGPGGVRMVQITRPTTAQ